LLNTAKIRHWVPAFAGTTLRVAFAGTTLRVAFAAVTALALPLPAFAHGFGRLYNLPVPFWLYAWGAAAALILSFAVVGWFVAQPAAPGAGAGRDLGQARWVAVLRRVRLVPVLRMLAVAALLLCIATGLFGSRDPYRNFSMTFFWVIFVLGFAYLTALIGNLYAAINPWRVLAEWLQRIVPGYARGRVRYPEALGAWPALAFYLAFIAFELFSLGRPFSLAVMLLAYTGINLAGVWLVGAQAWFRHCEFFGVFLRLVALMAPLDYVRGEGAPSVLRWRRPLSGTLQERPQSLGLVVFVLFMLASTAYDGLRSTQPWVGLFWNDPTGVLTRWAGQPPIQAYATVLPWYKVWDRFWLLAAPFVYFGVYLAFIALTRWAARSERPVRELALDFAYALLPIALVYNVTHYFTLLLTQGVKAASLLSDPFGWGWNLFGTAMLWRAPILPDLGWVWHAQVGLILLGHIASVYLAHRVALRVFPARGRAVLSQLPMLGLMVAFTVAGLWILAQPLTAMVAL